MGVQDTEREGDPNPGDPSVSPLRRRSFWRKAGAALVRLWAMWLVGFLLLTLPPLHRALKQQPDDVPPGVKPGDLEPPRADLRNLEEAVNRGDDAAILDCFRNSRLTPEERIRVQSRVDQLDDSSFRVRQRATDALVRFGPRVAGMLRRAARNRDVEVAERIRQVVGRFRRKPPDELLTSALKRLEKTPAPGVVTVLLDYLPDAESEAVADGVMAALTSRCEALWKVTGEVPDELFPALTDSIPVKRAAAGILLARFSRQVGSRITALLNDPDAEVRYRFALAYLLHRYAKEPLPVLIDLLPELGGREAFEVLDLLFRAAGAEAPAIGLGVGETGRLRCRDAWREWWRNHGEKLDLAKLDLVPPILRGSTLLVQLETRFNRGVIQEVDAKGKLKREVEVLDYPVWVEALANYRLLIVEYRGGRVWERHQNGEALWSVAVDHPVFAQRLPDGSTFIVSRDALWLADTKGSLRVFKSWPERLVATARRCLDGQTVVLTVDGTCLFLDADGKELRRFETGCKPVLAPGIDVTANKRVLVPDHAGQRILEFSPDGELLWQAPAVALREQTLPGVKGVNPFQQFVPISPACVQRLPNGNTLMTSTTGHEVNEIDRLGQVVWRLSLEKVFADRPARVNQLLVLSLRPVAATRR